MDSTSIISIITLLIVVSTGIFYTYIKTNEVRRLQEKLRKEIEKDAKEKIEYCETAAQIMGFIISGYGYRMQRVAYKWDTYIIVKE